MTEFIVQRAAANLPQSAQSALFTVSGGRVIVLAVVGEQTSALSGNCDAKLVSNPTAGSDTDLSSVGTLHNAVGELASLTGIYQSPTNDPLITGGAAVMAARPVVLPAGTLDLATSASVSGQLKWTLVYRPLDPGAKVEAA